MEEVIKITGIFMELFSILIFGTAFLGIHIKNIKNEFCLLWILSSVLAFLFQFLTNSLPWINLSVTLFILFILSTAILKIKTLFSLIMVFVSTGLFIFAEFLSLVLLDRFIDITDIVTNYVTYQRLLVAIPHVLLLTLLAALFNRYKLSFIPWSLIYDHKIDKKHIRHFQRYMAFMVVSFLIIIVLVFTVSYSAIYVDQDIEIIIFVTAVCTLYLLFFSQQLLKSEAVQLENHLEEKYQSDVTSYFRLIKAERHDFVHHLNALYGLISRNNLRDSKIYLEELLDDVRTTNESLPLYHPAISSMLLTLKLKAKKYDIDMSIEIKDPFINIPCRPSEINRIIGNIVDNAIDAIAHIAHSKKWIEVILESSQEDYVIIVSNSGELDQTTASKVFDEHFTTKKGTHQGIGLPASKKIVESYEGIIYLEIGEGFTTFIVNMPISKFKKGEI
ncbi:GHKL domain-containing protein [Metabacillus indicus]|uniref:sensor histidine kinase n=1 Tax=Metabacillus indicus TaxID=246786 RepID=UPI00316CB180